MVPALYLIPVCDFAVCLIGGELNKITEVLLNHAGNRAFIFL
jgi:hypothetical protein